MRLGAVCYAFIIARMKPNFAIRRPRITVAIGTLAAAEAWVQRAAVTGLTLDDRLVTFDSETGGFHAIRYQVHRKRQ
jgi:hypothetical protein